jgi:drug/metabolite transporter (DMT)-like permease
MLANTSATVRGMLWMVASGVLFTLLNTILKSLSQDLEPWLVGFLRYALGAAVMLVPVLRLGGAALWPKEPGLQFLRGLMHAIGIMFWFAAVPLVTISELTAIGFSGPIFICLGAVLFLKERMTGARWAAVLIGFAGVLLVVAPAGEDGWPSVHKGTLLMLVSTPIFAGSFLVAKVLTRQERSETMVLWQHLWTAVLLVPVAIAYWMPVAAWQWGLLLLCAVLGTAGHYCATQSFRVVDISAVQSVKFLELVWASLLGLVVFGVLPTFATLAGGGVILASTLWLARRESRGT